MVSEEAGTNVLASSCFWIIEQDAVLEWALLHWFDQLLQPYSTVRKWDDEIEFLRMTDFYPALFFLD